MNDLIQALTIFLKYMPDVPRPTSCVHDELYVHCDHDLVSPEDIETLASLGFNPTDDVEGFVSYRFGSC